MEKIVEVVSSLATSERVLGIMRALLVVLAALLAAPLARRALRKVAGGHLRPQQAMLARRAINYAIYLVALTWALRELGFEIGVLMGAAGVVTVAVGFASQTSVSNLISGLFLIFEQPFVMGDTIEAAGTTGEVLSIDLLSIKLRTADNLYVRIPNETLLKGAVTNLTRYPTRACVIPLSVAPGQDLERVRAIVVETARQHRLALPEPQPAVAVLGYNALAVQLQLTLWSERAAMGELKSDILTQLTRRFGETGIRLPAAPGCAVQPT